MSAVVLKPSPLIVFLASVLVSCAARVEYQSPSLPPPPPQPLVAEPLPEPYAPPPPAPPSPPVEGGSPSGSSRADAPTRRGAAARLHLSGGPVGLHGRSRMDLDTGRGDDGGGGRHAVRPPLHAGFRLDLVHLAVGLGPVPLRPLVPASVASGRMTRLLGGASPSDRSARS